MHTKQHILYKDTQKENKMIPIKQSKSVVCGNGEKKRSGEEE